MSQISVAAARFGLDTARLSESTNQLFTMKKTTKKPASTAKAATSAPAKKPAATARKKTAVQQPPATLITAKVDLGFGNHLYLRGEGPGLNWNTGIAMDCIAHDQWTATLQNATKPVIFKVLVNDITWSQGDDFVVEAGQSSTITPKF
jgi:hypothetical protein